VQLLQKIWMVAVEEILNDGLPPLHLLVGNMEIDEILKERIIENVTLFHANIEF